VSKKHDKATTPFHRAIDHPTMTVERIVALTRTYSLINPAATQRQIQALTAQLLTMNRPGMSGDSICWKGWSHGREFLEEVSAGVA
jgi:hypothetical protein